MQVNNGRTKDVEEREFYGIIVLEWDETDKLVWEFYSIYERGVIMCCVILRIIGKAMDKGGMKG